MKVIAIRDCNYRGLTFFAFQVIDQKVYYTCTPIWKKPMKLCLFSLSYDVLLWACSLYVWWLYELLIVMTPNAGRSGRLCDVLALWSSTTLLQTLLSFKELLDVRIYHCGTKWFKVLSVLNMFCCSYTNFDFKAFLQILAYHLLDFLFG